MAKRSWGLSATVSVVQQRGQGGCCHPSTRRTEQNHQGASTKGFTTFPCLPLASLYCLLLGSQVPLVGLPGVIPRAWPLLPGLPRMRPSAW